MFLMNVDGDDRQYAPAAEGNTSLDEDVNRVQVQYGASKVNVITCLLMLVLLAPTGTISGIAYTCTRK